MASTLSRSTRPTANGQPLAVDPPALASAPPGSASILIVDDDERSLLSLQAVIEPLGQRIVTAASGEEALRLLLREDFAVILLDMRLPGLDGLETARYINSRARTRHIPILFLTAQGDDVEQVINAYAAGAVDYVSKPYDPGLLRSKVAVFVELHRARAEHLLEARARAEAEATASTVGKLQAVSDAALAHLEMEELLPELLKRTRAVFGAHAAGVLLEGARDAEPALMTYDGERWERRQELSPEAAQRIALAAGGDGPDASQIDTLAAELGIEGPRSLAAAALSSGRRALGVLFLAAREEQRFSAEDREVLRLCGERVAIAITHARSYEHERGLVEVLQHHLLPDRLPRAPGLQLAARYRPGERAAQVGGDWYDALVLPDGRLGVVIGDVVGHGIAAATLMGELRAALRAYVMAEAQPPGAALASLNTLAASTHGGMVATLLYLVLDVDGPMLRFASAGHPPPLLIPAAGRAALIAHPSAPPLGAARRARFSEWEGELAAGATVVLYTDGLVERRGEPIDAGLGRLRDAADEGPVGLEQLCSHLLARAPREGVPDDAALLAVRRLEADPRLDVVLPAEPPSLAVARHRLERWLLDAGAGTEDLFAIMMAANEAATNAVEHAYGPERGPTFHLAASCRDATVELEVADAGHWRAPRGQQRGLGLQMIEQLMDSFEVERSGAGTRVRMRKQLTA